MPKFKYEAFTPGGGVDKGIIEAKNRETALDELRRRNLRAKNVSQLSNLTQDIKLSNPWPNGMDMSLFCSQFALMADARVSQSDTLEALIRTTSNERLKDALIDIGNRVSRGQSLTQAMGMHPRIFDRSFLALLTTALQTNSVPSTFRRLSEMYEKNVKVEQQVKGALVQPTITLSIALIVVIILALFVIPQMKSMLEGLNVPLPSVTRLLIQFTDIIRSPLGLIPLALIVGGIVSLRSYVSTKNGKEKFDQFILKIPKIGDLVRLGSLARVNRTLATLLSNGISKDEALSIASQASGNVVIEDVLIEARHSVEKGQLIYPVLERYPKLFPATITGMINTGEKQGELAAMLDRVSDFYERQVEIDAENLTKYIEPAMFIFLGVIVGGLVMAVMLPLASVIQNLST